MHIPEGFVSPQTFLPLAVVDAAVWYLALRSLRSGLDETTLPFLALSAAVVFVLTSVMLPIPGGTSAHLFAIGSVVALFGLRHAIVLFSLVLLIQALLFGQGGVSSFFVNVFAIAIAGPVAAWLAMRPFSEESGWGLFWGGVAGVLAAALVTSGLLGLQPLIASDAAGGPLFFPFGFSVVVPAVMLPHLLIALAEGVITRMAVPKIRKRMER